MASVMNEHQFEEESGLTRTDMYIIEDGVFDMLFKIVGDRATVVGAILTGCLSRLLLTGKPEDDKANLEAIMSALTSTVEKSRDNRKRRDNLHG